MDKTAAWPSQGISGLSAGVEGGDSEKVVKLDNFVCLRHS